MSASPRFDEADGFGGFAEVAGRCRVGDGLLVEAEELVEHDASGAGRRRAGAGGREMSARAAATASGLAVRR